MIPESFRHDYAFAYKESFGGIKSWLRMLSTKWLRLMFFGRIYEVTSSGIMRFLCGLIISRILKQTNSELSFNGSLGAGGVMLSHFTGVTVNSKTKIKGPIILYKGCTIGSIRTGNRAGCPSIGSRVVVGLNSTIVGGVNIGDDVFIAPNSFVNFDVPNNSLVIGSPGVIHHKSNPCEGYM